MRPDDPAVQAIFLRAHCRAMRAGLSHSNLTRSQIISKVSAITGKSYPRGTAGLDAAILDLNNFIKEQK
jgi:hypothetical protein